MKPFDTNAVFAPATGDAGMRQQVVRSAGATLFSQAVALVAQVIATVALARLVAPRDFGVVTIVTTFSLLLESAGLNGFTEAVLQKEDIDNALASNLFWITVGIGLLLTVGFAGAGSLLARVYHNDLVGRAAVGLSLTILLTGMSVMHLALLKRAMRFSAVSANEIVARVAMVVASIILAWFGWGYRALVAGFLAYRLAIAIGAWFLCRWIPRLPRRSTGTIAMVRFALNVYGRFSVNYFARNMDNLLVGWRFNAQALGFYKKAYDLFALSVGQLIAPLTSVAVSALSRLRQDPERFRHYLRQVLAMTAFVGMGLSADLTLIGKDLIRLLLGPGWENAGRIFTYFGPGIGIMLIYGVHGWIHLSIGRADRWFRWGLVEFTVTGLLFLLGLRWGPEGVAAAWSVSFWILTIPAFKYAGAPIGFEATSLVSTVWKYIAAALLAGGVVFTISRTFLPVTLGPGAAGAAARVSIISVVFGLLYLALVVLLHRSWAPLEQFAELAKDMAPARRLAGAVPVVTRDCEV